MISILAVNYDSDRFTRLLIRTAGDAPIVVVDNSCKPSGRWAVNPGERSHGAGLNFGLGLVETPRVLILDADCHMLYDGWSRVLRENLGSCDVVAAQGPPQKPLRPACVCLDTAYARGLDWRATPGYRGHRVTPEGSDVGILAYRRMIADGLRVDFMDAVRPSRYGTINGEEYGVGGVPLVYHHWHGCHDRRSDYPGIDLIADREKLFASFGRRPVWS